MTDTAVTVLLAEDEPSCPAQALAVQPGVQEHDTEQPKAALPDTEVPVVTDFVPMCWRSGLDNCLVRWVHATSAGVDALMIDPIRNSDIVVTNACIFDWCRRVRAGRGADVCQRHAHQPVTDARASLASQETRLLRDSLAVIVGAFDRPGSSPPAGRAGRTWWAPPAMPVTMQLRKGVCA